MGSAMLGWMSSLKKSFRASANGCIKPSGPTRFGPMRTCMRLMTRRSNHVMYAMPVSRAMMMTNERTASISRSDTRHQQLLAHDRGVVRMLVGDSRTNAFDVVRPGQAEPEVRCQLGNDGPVGTRVLWWRCAAFLVLDAALQVG